MILGIRTDTAVAQIVLVDGEAPISYDFDLGRSMAKELLGHIENLLSSQNLGWSGIKGIVVFSGPGSFTGLRIGVTIANTLAHGLQVPIVGSASDNWFNEGMSALSRGENGRVVLPVYGGEAHITKPRK